MKDKRSSERLQQNNWINFYEQEKKSKDELQKSNYLIEKQKMDEHMKAVRD